MTLRQPADYRALTLPAESAAHGRDKPRQRFQQRRLPAAVSADDGGHAAAFDDARNGAGDGLAIVTGDQLIHDDHGSITAQRTASPIRRVSASASKKRFSAESEKREVDI